MTSPLQSLIATGTKVWLDSVDPDFVKTNRALGATGATSNPIIISDLVKTGRYDEQLEHLLLEKGLKDDEAAWQLTDQIVRARKRSSYPYGSKRTGTMGM